MFVIRSLRSRWIVFPVDQCNQVVSYTYLEYLDFPSFVVYYYRYNLCSERLVVRVNARQHFCDYLSKILTNFYQRFEFFKSPNWFTYQVFAYLTETQFYHVYEIYTHCNSFFFPWVSFGTYSIFLLVVQVLLKENLKLGPHNFCFATAVLLESIFWLFCLTNLQLFIKKFLSIDPLGIVRYYSSAIYGINSLKNFLQA